MQIKIETDGTPENTSVINLRTGEEVKNLKVESVDFKPWWSNKDGSNISKGFIGADLALTGICPEPDACKVNGDCHGFYNAHTKPEDDYFLNVLHSTRSENA